MVEVPDVTGKDIKVATYELEDTLGFKIEREDVVSEKVARDRVLGRARGADDNVEVFNNRMRVYTEPLEQIEAFYEEKGIIKKINGERTIEEIVNEMDSFILSKI